MIDDYGMAFLSLNLDYTIFILCIFTFLRICLPNGGSLDFADARFFAQGRALHGMVKLGVAIVLVHSAAALWLTVLSVHTIALCARRRIKLPTL